MCIYSSFCQHFSRSCRNFVGRQTERGRESAGGHGHTLLEGVARPLHFYESTMKQLAGPAVNRTARCAIQIIVLMCHTGDWSDQSELSCIVQESRSTSLHWVYSPQPDESPCFFVLESRVLTYGGREVWAKQVNLLWHDVTASEKEYIFAMLP